MDAKCDLLHQLINNLTVVLGECELLRDKACDEANQRLTIIQQRATFMTELIRHHQCPALPQAPRRVGLVRSLVRTLVG